MSHSRLITIKIDPNLDRMWKAIGLSQKERAAEIQSLESTLIESYQAFMVHTNATLEELRTLLKQAQDEFKHTQRVYGDTTAALPSNPTSPLPDQIALIQQAIADLVRIYQVRVREFERLHAEIISLFTELGIEGDDRGEFADIGTEDCSVERLNRFKSTIKSLKGDRDQRRKLAESLSKRVSELAEELEETVSDELRLIMDRRVITNHAIQLLHASADSLQELKEKRSDEIELLNQELDRLYSILVIDPSNRMARRTENTQEVVDMLKQEVEIMQAEKETRLPLVIAGATKAIAKLCDQLRIPPKARPRFRGVGMEEEATFLTQELEALREKGIQCQPIIELRTQIEGCRETIEGQPGRFAEARLTPKQTLDLEKRKQVARELLPKLERKLLSLLLEFKERNGYDFDLKGLTGFRPTTVDATEAPHASRSMRRAPVPAQKQTPPSLGHQILMQKINESMVSGAAPAAGGRTSRATSLTARNPFV